MTDFRQRRPPRHLQRRQRGGLSPLFSCSSGQPQCAPSGHGNIIFNLNKNGYDGVPKKNITITISKQHSDDTVVLPTRASSRSMPCLLRIAPNDWLSPTDIFLNAHGIGQCGAFSPFPCSVPAPDGCRLYSAGTTGRICEIIISHRDRKCNSVFPISVSGYRVVRAPGSAASVREPAPPSGRLPAV